MKRREDRPAHVMLNGAGFGIHEHIHEANAGAEEDKACKKQPWRAGHHEKTCG
jgi:hypothetical protein